MAGIGETLRLERRRQRRSLADVAAETRVRESYLAAIESEQFDVLGGDVYARGFIRLYARYLGLDAEELVEVYRTEHAKPDAITAIPGATIDEILPPVGSRNVMQTPVLAAVGVVLVLVALFFFGRSRGGEPEVDPSAPGPLPTDVATDGAGGDPLASAPASPAGSESLAPGLSAAPPTDVDPLTGPLNVEILPIRDVRVRVVQGQPPVDASLGVGQGRVITSDQLVVVQLGDATAAEVRVNGAPLPPLGNDGQAVEVRCQVGSPGCEVRDV